MGSLARTLKRQAEQRRTFILEAEDAPKLTGKIRAVTLGDLLRSTGAAKSPYAPIFEGQLTPEQRREMTPSYADDPEGYEAFLSIGKRMSEAWLVLGIHSLVDEATGEPVSLTFSSGEDDEDAVTLSELREVYDADDLATIENAIHKLSNGTAKPGVVADSDTFRKATGRASLHRKNLLD